MPTQEGFSLAKLLIALAVVGLIGTWVVPRLLDHKDAEQTRLQQTVTQLSGIYGDIALYHQGGSKLDLKAVMQKKLNTVKWCNNQVIANGCWASTMVPPTDAVKQGGFILANGVHVTDINATPDNDGIFVDLNGPQPPNKLGEDTLTLGVCLDEKQPAGCGPKAWAPPGYTGPKTAGSLYPSGEASWRLWQKHMPAN
jgi:type II secretory pathway pseudopilin PulG